MKKILKLLAVWAAVTMVMLVALEGGLRIVFFHFPSLGMLPVEYMPHYIRVKDEVIPLAERRPRLDGELMDYYERVRYWEKLNGKDSIMGDLEPNTDVLEIFTRSVDHPYRVVANANGLRRKTDVAVPKPADVFRVYCLGDSYTFGPYLPNEETYPALLEDLLGMRNPGRKFEILNAGISGYSMWQQSDLFIKRGYRSQPDLVILQALDNDVPDYENPYLHPRPLDAGKVFPDSFVYRVKYALRQGARHSAILRAIREIKTRQSGEIEKYSEELKRFYMEGKRMGRIFAPAQNRSGRYDMWKDPERKDRLEEYKRKYENDFRKLVDFARERNIPLLVFLYPTELTLAYEREGGNPVNGFHAALAARYGADFVDLTPAFAAMDRDRLMYMWPWDGHPNFHGHLAAAGELAPVVERYIR